MPNEIDAKDVPLEARRLLPVMTIIESSSCPLLESPSPPAAVIIDPSFVAKVGKLSEGLRSLRTTILSILQPANPFSSES